MKSQFENVDEYLEIEKQIRGLEKCVQNGLLVSEDLLGFYEIKHLTNKNWKNTKK